MAQVITVPSRIPKPRLATTRTVCSELMNSELNIHRAYGRRVTFDWSGSSADVVKLQARAPRPSFLSVSLTGQSNATPTGWSSLRLTTSNPSRK